MNENFCTKQPDLKSFKESKNDLIHQPSYQPSYPHFALRNCSTKFMTNIFMSKTNDLVQVNVAVKIIFSAESLQGIVHP